MKEGYRDGNWILNNENGDLIRERNLDEKKFYN